MVARVIEAQHLAVFPIQEGLVFKGVNMTRPTLHKDVNRAPCLGREVGYLRRQRIESGSRLAAGQSGKREIAESAASRFQCLPSGHLA